MTSEDILQVLKESGSWKAADAATRNAFYGQMKNKQYGIGPLTQAWEWFWAGWCSYTE